MRRLRATIREETGRDLPVAVTEFNSHWSQAISGEATPDSFFSAIWLGDVLGRLIRQKVDLATQFLLVSGGESGFGILEKYGPRPAYFTYQMYKMFGDQLVYASSDDPAVSVYAALRADGALTIMAINLNDECRNHASAVDRLHARRRRRGLALRRRASGRADRRSGAGRMGRK